MKTILAFDQLSDRDDAIRRGQAALEIFSVIENPNGAKARVRGV